MGQARMPQEQVDSFINFFKKCPHQVLFDVIKHLKERGILVTSKEHLFDLSAKFKQLLRGSNEIPSEMMTGLHAAYEVQVRTAMALPNGQKMRTLPPNEDRMQSSDLLSHLSLISIDALSLSLAASAPSSRSVEQTLQIKYNTPVLDQQDLLHQKHQDLVKRLTSVPVYASAELEGRGAESMEGLLSERIRAAEGKGCSASSLEDANISGMCERSKMNNCLKSLVDCGNVFAMTVGDETFYVHCDHSEPYRCKGESGNPGLPFRPWLTFSGQMNQGVLEYFTSKILSVVFRNPGIREDSLSAQFDYFSEVHVREMLLSMAAAGLLRVEELQSSDGGVNRGTKHYFTALLPHQFLPQQQPSQVGV
uniref:Uncharacterized protein n=1 Tax=Chloropicon laureae TaxID=464258 RepID=A0A7S2Z4B0_9CHLO|mmetsp:Transcript_4450/g.11220  ORF Transcript_4450/g.11220 Transcript_4450/m.11220 type:complete len:364 (+) Transcript_4450:3-1094(+)